MKTFVPIGIAFLAIGIVSNRVFLILGLVFLTFGIGSAWRRK